MCSRLLQKMENYQGDLTDILRASSGGASSSSTTTAPAGMMMIADEWQFPAGSSKDFVLPIMAAADQETSLDEFGDPFSDMRDPLLHELDIPGSGFFTRPTSTSPDIMRPSSFAAGGGGNNMLVTQTISDDQEIMRTQTSNNNNNSSSSNNINNNSNIFSTVLQISPGAKLPVSPRDSSQVVAAAVATASPLVSNDLITSAATVNNSKGSLVENGGMQVQQISSPRNTGMKRRKSQAKKVVCIPAPAPANSRPSGEIVPSDLWAWRKYGQKPIKGSPYPRGYYRCSSSKGCSARKQVERSRTDPNMLVITYTSEHNHPWPTQRNALAGSTRAQPAKTGSSTSKPSQAQKSTNSTLKEEDNKESGVDNNASSSPPMGTPSSSACPSSMKEEMDDRDHDHHKQMEMDRFSEGFQQTYRPALPDSNHPEDFFADLGELEADPLNLLFSQGYSGDDEPVNKSLDPFSFYDWVNNTITTSTATTTTVLASTEEVNKGL